MPGPKAFQTTISHHKFKRVDRAFGLASVGLLALVVNSIKCRCFSTNQRKFSASACETSTSLCELSIVYAMATDRPFLFVMNIEMLQEQCVTGPTKITSTKFFEVFSILITFFLTFIIIIVIRNVIADIGLIFVMLTSSEIYRRTLKCGYINVAQVWQSVNEGLELAAITKLEDRA